MERFWIQLLAVLTLLTQTSTASDTRELVGAVGGAVTFRTHNSDGNAALWSVGDDPIVTVQFEDPSRPLFHQDKYKTRFTVSEDGRALSISWLRMEDAGTYSVTIGRKKSTFTLLVYRELPEPTVTCEAQDSSGSSSSSGVRVTVGVAVGVILLLFLVFFCKSQGWRKFHLPESKPSHPATTGESTTVPVEEGSSQQHIPNGIKPTPVGVESSCTIYSLVKRPEQAENGTVTDLELV